MNDWTRASKATCKGCKYEFLRHEITCPGCKRNKVDNHKRAKVVE